MANYIINCTVALCGLSILLSILFSIISAIKNKKEKDSFEIIYSHKWIATKYYSNKELARIITYAIKCFKDKDSLYLNDGIILKQFINHEGNIVFSNFEVYVQGDGLTDLETFGLNYPASYESIYAELHKKALKEIKDEEIIPDILTALNNSEYKTEALDDNKITSKKEQCINDTSGDIQASKSIQEFINDINTYCNNINDKKIKNKLKETNLLLSLIYKLELQFPESKNKVDKLYDHYLPILLEILEQYSSLQIADNDPEYSKTTDNLLQTLTLINDAMKSISSTMTEGDFINLSADMEALKSLLQKDGYSDQMTLHL